MKAAEKLYRFVLYACPARFRDEYGDESARDFAALADETRRRSGRLAVVLLSARAVGDLLSTAVRERPRVGDARTSLLSAVPLSARDAYRSLASKPAFTLLVVTTLALGIGANSAIFDAVYEVTLKPLPFPEAERLTMVFQTDLDSGERDDVSPADFTDWRRLSKSFDDLAAMTQTSMNVTGDGDPERLVAYRVSASLFPLLGVEPLLGRSFVADEDRSGGNRVAIVSHGLWTRRFGARREVLGEDIVLDGKPHRIVGVLPRWFRFPRRDVSLFVPLSMDNDEASTRNAYYLDVVGRVRSGVSVREAGEEMAALGARLAELHPETNADNGVLVRPLGDELVGTSATPLIVLFVAVSAVVLIAVVNIANLLIARSSAREKEVAIRAALGATRTRILGQLMTESALIALAGAGVGLLVATWSRGILQSLTPVHVAVDELWRPATWVFALGLAAAVAVGMGLLPALQLSRPGHGSLVGLRSAAGRSKAPLRSGLIVIEVATALVLLVLGGIMIRSFFYLTRSDPGFRPDNVLTMRIELSGNRYESHPQKLTFYRELEARVARLPGVRATGFITMLPLTFEGGSILFGMPDRLVDERAEPLTVFRSTTPGYFRTLGIPVIRGRVFDERDGAGAPRVAIVNETLERTYFGSERALGETLTIWGERAEIVGVVGDVEQLSFVRDVRPAIYVAALQRSYGFFDPRDFAVHMSGDPLSLAPSVRAEVWSIDPDQPIASIRTMDAIVASAISDQRVQAWLLGGFATVALALSALGIYGVLSHAVSERSDEIGIRMALGARTTDVLRLVAGQGMLLASAGMVIGLAVSSMVVGTVEGMLHAVEPFDAWTIVLAVALLTGVVLTACVLPGLRAARIDPVAAIRD